MAPTEDSHQIRYEPEESCPFFVWVFAGFQGVLLVLTPIVTAVTTAALVAKQSEQYLVWAAFAALVICGIATALQASRIWRVGTGHVLITAGSVSLVVVSVPALSAGGPAMLAGLCIAGALSQYALSAWLPLLRRVITPVVSGTALILLATSVIPIAAQRVASVPYGSVSYSGVVVAAATLAIVAGLGLKLSGGWRLWTPIIGIVAGCAVAAPFGLYDFQLVAGSKWVGVPGTWFPDFEMPEVGGFLALLPMAVIVMWINGIKNMGDSVVVQRLSRRRPRATDFRLVQGSLYANGTGVLLSGLAGSPPTTVNSAASGALVSLTGVASRRVGYAAGIILVALAFSPKLTAILLIIPGPVMGAYLLFLMGTYIVEGIRTVWQEGLDHGRGLILGLALSVGIGLETSGILGGLPGAQWFGFLNNGLTAGTLVAVLLTWFAEFTNSRPQRLEVPLTYSSLQEIDPFLREVAEKKGWDVAAVTRLRAAGEETLLSLLHPDTDNGPEERRNLTVVARSRNAGVELEFFASLEGQNLQDQLAYLNNEELQEDEASIRLLRHYAESVRHQKFNGMDVVRVTVADARNSSSPAE